jgi:hypothetical protein
VVVFGIEGKNQRSQSSENTAYRGRRHGGSHKRSACLAVSTLLQNDTKEAVLVSAENSRQTVSIPSEFRRVNGKPKFLDNKMGRQLGEVGCVKKKVGCFRHSQNSI